ncbi:hypothetical protein ATC00_24485 [Sinorhizobium americanum]|nr:hypothetical protein ATC00_24485 [Sinorhizobium americanum]
MVAKDVLDTPVQRPQHSYVLPTIDVDFSTIDIGRGRCAEEINCLGDFRRVAETSHWYLAGNEFVRAGRQDRRLYLARGYGISANSPASKLMSNFPGECRETCFRGCIGSACERMNARAGDRSYVHDGALAQLELGKKATGEQRRGNEINVQHLCPSARISAEHAQSALVRTFRRDTCIVDECVKLAGGKSAPHFCGQIVYLIDLR